MGEERLTWEEIVRRYPDQWVGLKDVEWEPDNDATISSAVVYRVGNPTDEDVMRAISGAAYERYTTPDRVLQMGVLGA